MGRLSQRDSEGDRDRSRGMLRWLYQGLWPWVTTESDGNPLRERQAERTELDRANGCRPTHVIPNDSEPSIKLWDNSKRPKYCVKAFVSTAWLQGWTLPIIILDLGRPPGNILQLPTYAMDCHGPLSPSTSSNILLFLLWPFARPSALT